MRDVSVVISTYAKDRIDSVSDCINSLKRQTALPYEIILVLDPNPSLIQYYQSRLNHEVQIVLSEEQGLSNARNAGVRNAHGEIVAFIDDDAVADDDWLRKLVKQYDDPLVFGVGGSVKPLWEGRRSYWFPEELDWIVGCSYKGLPEFKALVRNPIGCNMSFRKDVFDQIGAFRTSIGRFGKNLLAGEEPEFSLRLIRKIPEAKIIYDPSAIVYHKVPKERANIRYLIKRSFYEGLSKAIIKNEGFDSSRVMAVEQDYLKYMFNVAFPSRLRHFYRFENLCHVSTISTSMVAVTVGFLLGMVKGSKKGRQ